MDCVGDLAPQFLVFGFDLGEHSLKRGTRRRIAIQTQSERAVGRIVFEALEKRFEDTRIADMQTREQEGRVGTLLFTQFFI